MLGPPRYAPATV